MRWIVVFLIAIQLVTSDSAHTYNNTECTHQGAVYSNRAVWTSSENRTSIQNACVRKTFACIGGEVVPVLASEAELCPAENRDIACAMKSFTTCCPVYNCREKMKLLMNSGDGHSMETSNRVISLMMRIGDGESLDLNGGELILSPVQTVDSLKQTVNQLVQLEEPSKAETSLLQKISTILQNVHTREKQLRTKNENVQQSDHIQGKWQIQASFNSNSDENEKTQKDFPSSETMSLSSLIKTSMMNNQPGLINPKFNQRSSQTLVSQLISVLGDSKPGTQQQLIKLLVEMFGKGAQHEDKLVQEKNPAANISSSTNDTNCSQEGMIWTEVTPDLKPQSCLRTVLGCVNGRIIRSTTINRQQHVCQPPNNTYNPACVVKSFFTCCPVYSCSAKLQRLIEHQTTGETNSDLLTDFIKYVKVQDIIDHHPSQLLLYENLTVHRVEELLTDLTIPDNLKKELYQVQEMVGRITIPDEKSVRDILNGLTLSTNSIWNEDKEKFRFLLDWAEIALYKMSSHPELELHKSDFWAETIVMFLMSLQNRYKYKTVSISSKLLDHIIDATKDGKEFDEQFVLEELISTIKPLLMKTESTINNKYITQGDNWDSFHNDDENITPVEIHPDGGNIILPIRNTTSLYLPPASQEVPALSYNENSLLNYIKSKIEKGKKLEVPSLKNSKQASPVFKSEKNTFGVSVVDDNDTSGYSNTLQVPASVTDEAVGPNSTCRGVSVLINILDIIVTALMDYPDNTVLNSLIKYYRQFDDSTSELLSQVLSELYNEFENLKESVESINNSTNLKQLIAISKPSNYSSKQAQVPNLAAIESIVENNTMSPIEINQLMQQIIHFFSIQNTLNNTSFTESFTEILGGKDKAASLREFLIKLMDILSHKQSIPDEAKQDDRNITFYADKPSFPFNVTALKLIQSILNQNQSLHTVGDEITNSNQENIGASLDNSTNRNIRKTSKTNSDWNDVLAKLLTNDTGEWYMLNGGNLYDLMNSRYGENVNNHQGKNDASNKYSVHPTTTNKKEMHRSGENLNSLHNPDTYFENMDELQSLISKFFGGNRAVTPGKITQMDETELMRLIENINREQTFFKDTDHGEKTGKFDENRSDMDETILSHNKKFENKQKPDNTLDGPNNIHPSQNENEPRIESLKHIKPLIKTEKYVGNLDAMQQMLVDFFSKAKLADQNKAEDEVSSEISQLLSDIASVAPSFENNQDFNPEYDYGTVVNKSDTTDSNTLSNATNDTEIATEIDKSSMIYMLLESELESLDDASLQTMIKMSEEEFSTNYNDLLRKVTEAMSENPAEISENSGRLFNDLGHNRQRTQQHKQGNSEKPNRKHNKAHLTISKGGMPHLLNGTDTTTITPSSIKIQSSPVAKTNVDESLRALSILKQYFSKPSTPSQLTNKTDHEDMSSINDIFTVLQTESDPNSVAFSNIKHRFLDIIRQYLSQESIAQGVIELAMSDTLSPESSKLLLTLVHKLTSDNSSLSNTEMISGISLLQELISVLEFSGIASNKTEEKKDLSIKKKEQIDAIDIEKLFSQLKMFATDGANKAISTHNKPPDNSYDERRFPQEEEYNVNNNKIQKQEIISDSEVESGSSGPDMIRSTTQAPLHVQISPVTTASKHKVDTIEKPLPKKEVIESVYTYNGERLKGGNGKNFKQVEDTSDENSIEYLLSIFSKFLDSNEKGSGQRKMDLSEEVNSNTKNQTYKNDEDMTELQRFDETEDISKNSDFTKKHHNIDQKNKFSPDYDLLRQLLESDFLKNSGTGVDDKMPPASQSDQVEGENFKLIEGKKKINDKLTVKPVSLKSLKKGNIEKTRGLDEQNNWLNDVLFSFQPYNQNDHLYSTRSLSSSLRKHREEISKKDRQNVVELSKKYLSTNGDEYLTNAIKRIEGHAEKSIKSEQVEKHHQEMDAFLTKDVKTIMSTSENNDFKDMLNNQAIENRYDSKLNSNDSSMNDDLYKQLRKEMENRFDSLFDSGHENSHGDSQPIDAAEFLRLFKKQQHKSDRFGNGKENKEVFLTDRSSDVGENLYEDNSIENKTNNDKKIQDNRMTFGKPSEYLLENINTPLISNVVPTIDEIGKHSNYPVKYMPELDRLIKLIQGSSSNTNDGKPLNNYWHSSRSNVGKSRSRSYSTKDNSFTQIDLQNEKQGAASTNSRVIIKKMRLAGSSPRVTLLNNNPNISINTLEHPFKNLKSSIKHPNSNIGEVKGSENSRKVQAEVMNVLPKVVRPQNDHVHDFTIDNAQLTGKRDESPTLKDIESGDSPRNHELDNLPESGPRGRINFMHNNFFFT